MHVRGRWLFLIVSPAALSVGLVGCMQPEATARKAPLAPDIFKIVKFFDPATMWRSYNQVDINPEGFKLTLYLISSKTQKGAFGDGTIKVDMYVAARDSEGRRRYELAKAWSFESDEAMPFRIKRQAELGWAYQLYLNWGDADVLGKEVRISVSYVRRDGRVILSRPIDRRVPVYDLDAYKAAHAEPKV